MERSPSSSPTPVTVTMDAKIEPSSTPPSSPRLPTTPAKKRKSSAIPISKNKPKPRSDTNATKSSVKLDIAPEGRLLRWDGDGREALVDHLIAEGLKAVDKAQLAEKFGVTKQKIHNELSRGRAGNLRSRVTKAARD